MIPFRDINEILVSIPAIFKLRWLGIHQWIQAGERKGFKPLCANSGTAQPKDNLTSKLSLPPQSPILMSRSHGIPPPRVQKIAKLNFQRSLKIVTLLTIKFLLFRNESWREVRALFWKKRKNCMVFSHIIY